VRLLARGAALAALAATLAAQPAAARTNDTSAPAHKPRTARTARTYHTRTDTSAPVRTDTTVRAHKPRTAHKPHKPNTARSTPNTRGRRVAHRAQTGGATPASVLAPTPYMGWDSYFTFGGRFDEAAVLEQASELVTRGLAKEGYRYVWLDVGWWQGARTPSGEIEVNPTQWPHGMRWLAETLHRAGLKLGVYTDAGRNGCGGAGQGSGGHYQQDANTLAAWGVDAIKMDFCGGIREGLAPASAYAAFHEAIVHNASHRPMLLSICDYLQPGQFAGGNPSYENSAFSSYTFGPTAGNSWRTDTDVGVPGSVEFPQVLRNMQADAAQPQAAGPGHWNDPDYLGPDQGMTDAQFRTQFSMWAMLAAPLMISADLISLSQTSQATVSNPQAIAIDQDPAGLQARLLAAQGEGQVWVKPLANGDRAVALLNVGPNTLHIATSTSAIGMGPASGYTVRNVWSGTASNVGSGATLSASVPSDSTVLLRVTPN
jgi:alpha-galactosidase